MTSRPDTNYEHTQTAKTNIVTAIALLPVAIVLVASAGEQDLAVVILLLVSIGLVLAIVTLFSRLTVEVSVTQVRLFWSFGWPARSIARSDIRSVEVVRNRWIYGWGIRVVRGGWLWNVWGLDAVELELADERKFRIGTDEPYELAAALAS